MVLHPAAPACWPAFSGLTLLEIFCPNPNKYHILLWHIGAALVSTIGGAAMGWIADTLLTHNSQRKAA
jgi:hypothetical protein